MKRTKLNQGAVGVGIVCLLAIICGAIIYKLNAGKIYTAKDIFLESFRCGYINEYSTINNTLVIIENEEQLAFAEERYGLAVLDSSQREEYWQFESPLASWIQYMKEHYPIEKYNYVFVYESVGSGGYNIHADRLRITKDHIYFLESDESYAPKSGEYVTEIVDGFVHVAAVPKEYMSEHEFPYAVYPNVDDMYQDRNYMVCISADIADEKLYQAYGDKKYIIRSQEEYETFLDIAKGVSLNERKALRNDWINFDEVAMLVYFFVQDDLSYYDEKPVEIIDNHIVMDYEMRKGSSEEELKPCTRMIYAHIPKRFLTEESYEGWTNIEDIAAVEE